MVHLLKLHQLLFHSCVQFVSKHFNFLENYLNALTIGFLPQLRFLSLPNLNRINFCFIYYYYSINIHLVKTNQHLLYWDYYSLNSKKLIISIQALLNEDSY